jgi:hypothetical protein
MLRLIENDLRLNAIWLFSIFVIMNLDLAVLAHFHLLRYGLRGVQVGFAFILPITLPIFLREESYIGQVIYRSIPVSRWKLVLSRYLTVCLLAMACVVYGWFYQSVIDHFDPSMRRILGLYRVMDPGYLVEHSLIARTFEYSIIFAVAIPLMIRFGSVWRIVIGFIALWFFRSTVVDYLLDYSLHSAFFLGLSRWMFFAVLILIAIASISIWVSTWLYSKRDL